jgi:hypothetical protein
MVIGNRTPAEKLGDEIQKDWIAKIGKYGLYTALDMFGGKNPIDSYWESVKRKYDEIKTSPEIKALEVEIDDIQDEIHIFVHPEFAKYFEERRSRKKAVETTINEELELKKQKYLDSLSASKGSLTNGLIIKWMHSLASEHPISITR